MWVLALVLAAFNLAGLGLTIGLWRAHLRYREEYKRSSLPLADYRTGYFHMTLINLTMFLCVLWLAYISYE